MNAISNKCTSIGVTDIF